MNHNKVKATLGWAVFIGMCVLSVITTHSSAVVLLKRGSRFFDITGQMIPPAWAYSSVVLQPLWATIQMSFAGTVLGACFGFIGAMLANSYINRISWLRRVGRFFGINNIYYGSSCPYGIRRYGKYEYPICPGLRSCWMRCVESLCTDDFAGSIAGIYDKCLIYARSQRASCCYFGIRWGWWYWAASQ